MRKLPPLLLAALLACCLTAAAARASTTVDVRGDWDVVSHYGGSQSNYTETFTNEDFSTGAMSGHGSGGSYTWPVSGTLNGSALTMAEGPYDQLPSYTSTVTATVAPDGNTIDGTFSDSNGTTGTITFTRTSGPPATTPVKQIPPQCTDPTTLLVTCQSDAPAPGVCGPTGSILPACYLPVDLPTVCGPSGTILPACTSAGPYVVACGGTGTILPPCHLPPPNLPQVCGGSFSVLPKCTGANNPIVVCGPSGTILPQCSFQTKIKAAVLNLPSNSKQDSGEVDIDMSCPSTLAVTAARGARAAKSKAKTCDVSTVLNTVRDEKDSALSAEAAALSQQYVTTANVVQGASTLGLGTAVITVDPPVSSAEAAKFGPGNARVFVARAAALRFKYFFSNPLPFPPTAGEMRDALDVRIGTPSYVGPPILTSPSLVTAPAQLGAEIAESYGEYYKLRQKLGKGSSLSGLAAKKKSKTKKRGKKKAANALVKHFKLRRGRHRLRLHLSRKVARRLGADAGKHGKVAVLRVALAFKAKPYPVVRFVDVAVTVKRHKHKRR